MSNMHRRRESETPLEIEPQDFAESLIKLAGTSWLAFNLFYSTLLDVPARHYAGKPLEDMVDDLVQALDADDNDDFLDRIDRFSIALRMAGWDEIEG